MRSRLVVLAALALGAGLARPAAVSAQPADAIGRPLNEASLRDGTVTVRVIAGDRDKPVNGTEVTLMTTPPDGTTAAAALVARTDSDGRATFSNIAPDTMVQAKVTGDAGEVTSSRFPMPASGGTKLLLSTIPLPGGPAGPMAGAGGAPMMANPRAMSGRPRPQPGDANDTITVRLSYDDFADPSPPKDHPVILVGYRFDLAVAGEVLKTDAAGRVAFDELDRRGATTYFAMTLLPRGEDVDRLISQPIMLPGDHGIRLILSGDKRAVGVPVDDQSTIDTQPSGGVPAGEVRVAIAGLVQPGDPIELVDALTGKVVATTKATPPIPDAASVVPTWATGADIATLPTGTLGVMVGANGAPAEGARVDVRRKATVQPGPPAEAAPVPSTAFTDAKGEVTLGGLPTGVELEIIVTVDGMAQAPRPVTLPATGGRREQLAVAWESRGQASARFTGVAGGPERAFLVRAFLRDQPCLSPPFMMPASRGVSASVLVFPRVFFTFSLDSWVDDIYFGTRGTFRITNSSLAPYVPGTIKKLEELVIPLPKGFVGATVRQDFADTVGVDPTRGFIIRDPVPPGGFAFFAAFSLKHDDGELRWDLELPYGTFESQLAIKRTADMEIDVPPRTRVREHEEESGRWFALSPITVLPKQRMVFTLTGLPERAAWVRWGSRAIGGVVVAVLLGTLAFVLVPRRRTGAGDRTRYQQLVEELAALGEPAAGEDPATTARRDRLLDELEVLHRAGAAGS